MDAAPIPATQYPDRPIRRFPLNSIAGLMEDLVAVAAAGGLGCSDPTTLQATYYGLFPGVTHESYHGWWARCFLRVHIRRVCLEFPAKDPTDPRLQTVGATMRRVLLQPGPTPERPEVIRREALEEFGCTVAPADLSGLEQLIAQQIARSAYAALQQRAVWRSGVTPQTVEEVVYLMLPHIARHRENVSKTMRQLSSPWERRRRAQWEAFLDYSLYYFVHVRQWCHLLLRLPERQHEVSRIETMFVELAGWILEVRFEASEADRAVLEQVADRPEAEGMSALRDTLKRIPEGERLLDDWWAWLISCPRTCTYHRSKALANVCQPHRFLVFLEQFERVGAVLLLGREA